MKLIDLLKEKVDKKWPLNWHNATSKLLDSISWVSALTYAPKVPNEIKKDKKLRKLVDELLKQYNRIEKHVDKMGYQKSRGQV